ncbi:MAG: type 4a pilus biogenesis protein PilO [Deltaproteobacteria bacterium]|nr:type 4a pilus biogenesis protein PilO [Deltaproteobacteria bacterium]
MSSPRGKSQIWRTKAWLWIPPLVFFFLNLGAWAYYHGAGLGDQVSLLRDRLSGQLERENSLAQETANLQAFENQASESQQRIQEMYSLRLATQQQRLTAIVSEVRELARESGLEPNSVSYPEQSFQDFGLQQKSFVFSVAGRYEDLRRLINALELTPSFLILDEISLNEQGGGSRGSLRISLRISTLFSIDEIEAPDVEIIEVGAGETTT